MIPTPQARSPPRRQLRYRTHYSNAHGPAFRLDTIQCGRAIVFYHIKLEER